VKAVKVPADFTEPIAVIDVDYGWQHFAKAIGGPCQYIERFACPLTPEHSLVGVVDEDGQFNGQLPNTRTWPLYPVPGYLLAGDVLIMAEGMTPDGPDFVDLPDPDLALELVERLIG
jgi:hypothetical protein